MGCGKEDSVQPSASNTHKDANRYSFDQQIADRDKSSIKVPKPPNKNSVTGVYQMVSPDGIKLTVQFDLNGSYSESITTPDPEFGEQALEWEIKDNKLYVFDRKLKRGEWYHAQYDIQENGDLIIKTIWDHGAGYPDGKPLRLEVPKNKQTPFRKIKFAETKAMAEAGDINSQYNLAVMYAEGLGVLRDDKEAIEWYHKSAEQGFAAAQLNLGVMYANGQGVLQDDKEAVEWYRKAAKQGSAVAQFNLGLMCANGRGVLQDDKEAVGWYRKAAEQGYAGAQLNLGVMYATDRGVPKDFVIAYAFANIAEANGFDVKRFKSLLEKEMIYDDVSKAQELSGEMVKKNPKLLNK